jgi:hypothetical protein
MVGGTRVHRSVIQREISRVLVLNLSGEKCGFKTAGEKCRLTKPSLLSRGTRPYYTGLISHSVFDQVRPATFASFLHSDSRTLMQNLTVNKPPVLTGTVLLILWLIYIVLTVWIPMLSVYIHAVNPYGDVLRPNSAAQNVDIVRQIDSGSLTT